MGRAEQQVAIAGGPVHLDLGPVFDSAHLPLAITDRQLRIVAANPAFCHLTGNPSPKGMLLPELAEGNRFALYQTAARAALSGVPAEGILAIYPSSEGPRSAELQLELLPGRSDGEKMVLVQVRDLTHERELEARVMQSLRLHSAFASGSETLLRTTTAQGLWQAACDLAVEQGGLRMAWVGVVNEATGFIEPMATAGADSEYLTGLRISVDETIPEGRGPAGMALRNGDACVFENVLVDPFFAPWRARAEAAGFRSVAALPLLRTNSVRAVLTVFSELPDFFREGVLPLMSRLANNVSLAWESLERQERERDVQEEMRSVTERFELVFEQSGVAGALLDSDLKFLQVNTAMGRLLGIGDGTLLGRALPEFIHQDDRHLLGEPLVIEPLEGQSDRGRTRPRVLREDGEVVWVVASSTHLPAIPNHPAVIIWQAQDVSAQRHAEELAERRSGQQAAVAQLGREALSAATLEGLMDSAAQTVATGLGADLSAVLELDAERDLFRLVAGTGWQPGLVGTAMVQAGRGDGDGEEASAAAKGLSPGDSRDLDDPLRGSPLLAGHHAVCGISVAINAGSRVWGSISAHTTVSHAFSREDLNFLTGVALVLGAAVSRVESERELQRQALHDPLTGLPNRTLVVDRIALGLSRLNRRRRLLTVMFLDLDRFKMINDSLGHASGDAVLREVAARLRATLRPSDTIARAGGDEFVLLGEEISGPEQAAAMAARVVAALEAPIKIGDEEVVVSGSVGFTLTDSAAADPEELIRDADVAMYYAKSRGGRMPIMFDETMRQRFSDRLRAETDLRRAILRGEFVIHYQPVIDVASGDVVGAEALVRWDRPGVGLVPPNDFIPLAEETGAITEIGAWVLSQACRAGARWSAERPGRPFRLSVNLSVRQLHDPELPTLVRRALKESGLSPGQLCLEITETAMMVDSKGAVVRLAALKRLGVMVALDDFGTGYSSISHLKRFALDQLKVDKSFVDGVDLDGKDRAIVDGLVKLAHAVGLEVAAEGVERGPQMAALRGLGCDLVQGFLMSRPVSGEEFGRLWHADRPEPARV